ncbi:MAG: Ig-like domain-containing protein, partial [Gemmatimonadetes bacterium]|nr:Ig-like domain-containing protein [Gemmatimonadota bacterium]
MSTDRASLIGRFMQSVRRLTFRQLVSLAVLSTTAILACKDDPTGLDGTGRLVLRIVPLEEAQPATGSRAATNEAANSGRTKSVTPKAGDSLPVVDSGSASDEVLAQVAQAQVPRRDILRVIIEGPTPFSQDYSPNADGSLDVTIPDLAVGTYTVQVWGMDTDLGGPLVSEFGTTSGVRVQEDLTSTATIPFGSFLPVIDPTLPAQTSEFSFVVDYSAVPSATGYFFELDTDPSFSAPTTLSTAGTSVIINAGTLGPNWMRVRAENNNVSAAQAKPSDPVLVDVVADINPTGDDNTTAPSLGVGRGANGQYGNFNIYPATDEDWFAIDLTTDATLTVDVLTESLSSPPSGAALEVISAASGPSPLDPVVDIYDPSLTVIETNDDRDGTTVESRVSDVTIPVDGTYFIRVTSFLGGSVGHYELLITVNAEPVARVQIDPPSAAILPGSTVDLTGRTFDQFDVELFGREAIWSSSDDVIATVDGTGLVTGQSLGTATITFESEGISGTATIDVTNVSAAKVVITPTGNVIDGIGQTAAFMAEAFDDQDVLIPGKPINWYAANTYVADVDDTGLARSVGHGQTVITAEADGVEGYAVVTVNDVTTIEANFWDVHPQASGTAQILRDVWAERKDAVYVVGQTGTVLFNNGTGWAAQTNPATDAVRAIWGVDEYSLVAVGNGGLIMETGDMGQNWVAESPSPTSLDLWDVWGSSLDNVWAVGGNGSVAGTGIIVHYDGLAWAVEPTGTIDHVAALWGFASDDVWAVGDFGQILHYDGTSWVTQASPTVNNFTAVWGPRSTDLFAATSAGEVFRYNGTIWAPQSIPASPGLWAIHGTSMDDVYVVGETGTIVHFNGTNWNAIQSTAIDNLLGVFSTPNGNVIAVGNGGMIQLGTRGATVVVTPGPSELNALGEQVQLSGEVRDAAGTVVASGDIFSWTSSDDLIATVSATGLVTAVANGTVTITANISGMSGTADVTVRQLAATITVAPNGTNATTTGAGLTFTATANDANANPIPGAAFTWSSLNPNVATINATTGQITVLASGQATIAAELDGTLGYALVNVAITGATPVNLMSTDPSGTTVVLSDVWGTASDDVFAVGTGGTVRHFDGSAWSSQTSNTTFDLEAVWGASSTDVFATASNGVIHYDGSAWSTSTSGFGNTMRTIWGAAPDDVWAAGVAGQIIHKDASGWGAVAPVTADALYGIWGSSASDVFFVGDAGTILHWDGTTFAAMTSGTVAGLRDVWGLNGSDVFAVGTGGVILRYNGTIWSIMTSGVTDDLFGVWGTSSSDVYAVGANGTVLRFDGITWSALSSPYTGTLQGVRGTPNPSLFIIGDAGLIGRASRGVVLSVTPTSHTFDALGSTQLITAIVTDENATDVTAISDVPFTWASTDDLVATVDPGGNVTSTGNGSATISAAVQGLTANAAITVSQVAVAFAIVPNSASLAIGETLQLIGGSLDANNNPLETQSPITWSTSDASIADVDINGLVTAFGLGTATITADDGIATPATAAITVTVPNTATTIAAGDNHSCAIADGGVAYCWGQNSSGQLGDGTTNTSVSPIQVTGGLTFASITTGGNYSCGLTPDGTAYCWGQNGQGQLGDNTFANSSTPVAVAGGLQFAEVSGGRSFTCAITTTG